MLHMLLLLLIKQCEEITLSTWAYIHQEEESVQTHFDTICFKTYKEIKGSTHSTYLSSLIVHFTLFLRSSTFVSAHILKLNQLD